MDPDSKKILEFVQSQAKDDRTAFDVIHKRTMWYIAVFIAAASGIAFYLQWNSLSQLRDQARSQTDEAIKSMQVEVRKRIETEFETERIQNLIKAAAVTAVTAKANAETNKLIAAEVKSAVAGQRYVIDSAVREETRRAVHNLTPTIDNAVATQAQAKVDAA